MLYLGGTRVNRDNPCPCRLGSPGVHFTSRVVPMAARFDFNVNLNVDYQAYITYITT